MTGNISAKKATKSLKRGGVKLSTRLLGPFGVFLQGAIQHPAMVGAVFPSSKATIANMMKRVDWQDCKLVVEYGPKDQVLNNPSHPYTQALLKALPTLGEKRDRLQTIPGEPPHAGNLPPACPFHPRCEQAMDTCKEGDAPPDYYLGNGHQARCWLLEKDYEQYSH